VHGLWLDHRNGKIKYFGLKMIVEVRFNEFIYLGIGASVMM
jgi:hypothetical protein